MKPSRTPTWARLRVYFATLLLGLFALGGLLVYASSLSDPTIDQRRTSFRILGVEVMAFAVMAWALARMLSNRLWRD